MDFTSRILTSDPEDRQPIIKDLVQAIRGKDLALQLQTASNAKHLCKIADTVGWKKLWDHALDHGEACITSLRNLVRVVSYPKHAISSCPLCEASELDVPLPGHIIEKHTNSTESWDTLFNSLLNLNSSCFSHLLCSLIFFNYCYRLCLFSFVIAQVGSIYIYIYIYYYYYY